MSFDSSAERMGSPRGPSGVSATICATNAKFLSSAPDTRSPISSLLQPIYWHRPPALAHRMGRVSGVRALLRARLVPPILSSSIARSAVIAEVALGASGVQIGTAFLGCPEATVPSVHREALHRAADEDTRLTRVF